MDAVGEWDEVSAARRSYDAVAVEYAARIADELRGKPLDRGLLDAVAELAVGGTVADVGCGPGHVAAYLADRGACVVGLDLSPVMCSIARSTTRLPFSAANMTALPIRSNTMAAVVSLYAVIHLDEVGRAKAYAEFSRVLRPGGHALVAFHSGDPDVPGGVNKLTDWWGSAVALTFRFLDPSIEVDLLAAAGLELVARLDRAPHPGIEHPSERSYLLVRRP